MKQLLIILLLTQLSACQNKHTENQKTDSTKMQTTQERKTTFKWEEGLNAPQGYPIEVYRGGLELATGFVGLSGLGTTTGFTGWGNDSNGMSSGIKSLPKRINCIWLSYAEDCMYEINCDVDYEKIVQLFNEGYISGIRKRGKQMTTYNKIMVGFAPGGVVVLWVSGGDKKVEIGSYLGKKTTVSPQEIALLDSHEQLLFDPKMRKHVMENPRVVPPEVQAINKNKPIPFGLWDTYREKYSWKPIFSLPDNGKMYDDFRIEMANGEVETLRYEEFIKNDFKERAIPKRFSFGWWDKNGQGYGGSVLFDEKEISNAYALFFKEENSKQIELEIKVNMSNTFFTIKLKSTSKEIALTNNKIEVFESRLLTKKYVKE
jgi:hypothetical protein